MNYRTSKQREAILSLLSKKNYHPTAYEIYDIVRKDFPRMSIATVYRNVDQLSQMAKIRKLEATNAPAKYDGNMEKHYHITCERCGAVDDVWLDSNIDKKFDISEFIPEHNLTGFKLEFYGICANCCKIS